MQTHTGDTLKGKTFLMSQLTCFSHRQAARLLFLHPIKKELQIKKKNNAELPLNVIAVSNHLVKEKQKRNSR